MAITSFQDLLVWQKAHQLTLLTYRLVSKFPKHEEYGLASQMRRSSSSIPSNIAEGFKRKGLKDSIRFYNIAEGSLEELKYQLILSKDLEYISTEEFDKIFRECESVGGLLNNWKKSQHY
ncbi:MAG: four helix bundle protein [Patescibacteria group bacterium]|jgi:four helix bundle protein